MTNQIQVTTYQQDTHCIYVCNQTGEAYINWAQLDRLFPNTPSSTLRDNIKSLRGAEGIEISSVIETQGGLQGVRLYPSMVIAELAIKLDPKLAKEMMRAGAKLYLYGLAGYQVSITPQPTPSQPLTSSNALALTSAFQETLKQIEASHQEELVSYHQRIYDLGEKLWDTEHELEALKQRPNLDQVQQLLAAATAELTKISRNEPEQPSPAPTIGRTWPLSKVIGLSGLTKAGFLRIWRKDGFIAAKSEFPTYEEMLAGRMMVVDGVTHITESGQQHYSQHMKTLDKLLIN